MSKRALPLTRMIEKRSQRDWSQSDLALQAGIPRTTVSAIEGGRLTPSVRTALSMARALDCTVEDLFGGAREPSPTPPWTWAWKPRSVPSRYWKAEVGGRRLLYPVEGMALGGIRHDGLWTQEHAANTSGPLAESTLVIASCDPAAGLIAREYAQSSGFRLLVFPRSGRQALDLLKNGLVHLAGVHRATPERPLLNREWTRSEVGDEFSCLRAAAWTEGLALPPENRARSAKAVARGVDRWALRENGSAARECLDELCGGAHLHGQTVGSHAAVAESVRSGWAEAGVCVRLCAEEAGLNFIPLRTEFLDLCFKTSFQRDPRFIALTKLFRSPSYRRLIAELPGYDSRNSGEWIAN